MLCPSLSQVVPPCADGGPDTQCQPSTVSATGSSEPAACRPAIRSWNFRTISVASAHGAPLPAAPITCRDSPLAAVTVPQEPSAGAGAGPAGGGSVGGGSVGGAAGAGVLLAGPGASGIGGRLVDESAAAVDEAGVGGGAGAGSLPHAPRSSPTAPTVTSRTARLVNTELVNVLPSLHGWNDPIVAQPPHGIRD